MTHIKEIFEKLPPIPDRDVTNTLLKSREKRVDAIIVLDDDPTGTQTVHDLPVLTEWTVSTLQQQFESGTPLFYILTNSRSLTEAEAATLSTEIGSNIRKASELTGTRCWVISRSDSTLRGHYPTEVDALAAALEENEEVRFIIPCFFEGGRYTINDVHYVQQGDELVPASETPYAKDPVFGYEQSDLKKWVEEKTGGRVSQHHVASVSLHDLRVGSLQHLISKLSKLEGGSHCIVNATCYADLRIFCLALLSTNIHPLMRSAASLVAALGCQEPKDLLSGEELACGKGGLVVVGSFVSTTTSQLNHLLENSSNLTPLELVVDDLLQDEHNVYTDKLAREIEDGLDNGKIIVLFTSRKLVTGLTDEQNQEIGKKVSRSITRIVSALRSQPGFLVSKGGITSSDIATKALGAKKAMVKGQIIKGVPVWEHGEESKFPGLNQVIFPGNVGQDHSLTEVVKILVN